MGSEHRSAHAGGPGARTESAPCARGQIGACSSPDCGPSSRPAHGLLMLGTVLQIMSDMSHVAQTLVLVQVEAQA